MNYIDNDDYWAKQWQLEDDSAWACLERERIDNQNSAGVDLPFLGGYCTPIDFVDCIFESTEVPF